MRKNHYSGITLCYKVIPVVYLSKEKPLLMYSVYKTSCDIVSKITRKFPD